MSNSPLASDRPIRDLLAELTVVANQKRYDSFEAYIWFREQLKKAGLHTDTYCSSSITSGGHARHKGLGVEKIIARNTELTFAMCDELFEVEQLDAHASVEAVALGYIKGWHQNEYMSFWLAIMAGLPSSGRGIAQAIKMLRRDFYEACHTSELLDMEQFNSSMLTKEERAPHYFEYAKLFAHVLRQSPYTVEPVKRLVRLVDPDQSLGAQTENVFAHVMGTKVFSVSVATRGQSPDEAYISPKLVRDSRKIVEFGGTVFDNRRGQQLIIIPQNQSDNLSGNFVSEKI